MEKSKSALGSAIAIGLMIALARVLEEEYQYPTWAAFLYSGGLILLASVVGLYVWFRILSLPFNFIRDEGLVGLGRRIHKKLVRPLLFGRKGTR